MLRRLWLVTPLLAATADRPALAQSSGTWNVDAGGEWFHSGNWVGGSIPNASQATANFNFNITTTRTILLSNGGSPQNVTAGVLNFSDNGGTGSGWVIAGPGTLTLSNFLSPIITATTDVTISAALAGSGGLTKRGPATLVIAGPSLYTGGSTNIEGGTLQLGDGGTTGSAAGFLIFSAGSTLAVNRSDTVTLTNSLFGTGTIRQIGSGTTIVNSSGSLDGDVSIEAGVFQTGAGSFLSGNIAIAGGGILQTSNNFTRALGTGDGQVRFAGSGGFSATNTTLTVDLGGSGSTLTWGQANFLSGSNTLVFGSDSSAARTVFNNSLSLGGAARTIRVIDNAGSTADVTEIEGSISNGGLIKDGAGTLVLTGSNSYNGGTTILAGTLQVGSGFNTSMITGTVFNSGTLVFNNSTTATFAGNVTSTGRLVQTNTIGALVLTGTNTYTGQTEIAGGRLVAQGAASLSGANLLFTSTGTSGTLLTSGTFTRSIGTGTGQVQWTGSGGFGNNTTTGLLTVNLGGAGQQVVWGSGNFVPFGSALLFTAGTVNSLTASTRFVNPINLNGGMGNVSVTNSGFSGGLVELSGAISNGGLTKSGDSLLVLTGANTFAGGTTVLNGVLRADEGATLPTTGLLTLSGGRLETSGQFTRSLGTGSGQLDWRAGGFAAFGDDLTVNIGGVGAELAWGSAEFNPTSLTFGSADSRHDTQLVNGIDLGGATRLFSTISDAEFSGVIRNGGLQKNNGGTLWLTGANTYTGGTTVGGALRAIDGVGLPTAGNLRFAGGTFESSGAFTRALGTGSGQVSWEGHGGFGAYGGDLTVNLGGAGATLVWGQGGFTAGELWLGGSDTDSKTTLVNGIDLNGGSRILRLFASRATDSDSYEIAGSISNGQLSVQANSGDRDALLILSGANSYDEITLGFLSEVRAIEGVGLPTAARLLLQAGVFQSSGSFTRLVGTGLGQVSFGGGGGGFSAYGGQFTINLGGFGSTLTWGAGSFIPAGALFLGGGHGDSKLLWQNGLNLGGSERVIDVADNPGSAGDFAEIAAPIVNGSIRKDGDGLLVLSSAANSIGSLTIRGGAVRVVNGAGLPTTAGLSFLDGVWESSGEASFTRAVGSGANTVGWAFDGGFSASGGDLAVNLGGAGGILTWDSGRFVDNGRTLILSSRFADSKVNFVNGINLNAAVRTIRVDENVFSSADSAEISGSLSNGGLLKTGAGMLVLSNNNTYGLGTTVSAGTLRAANDSAMGSGAVIVSSGARLDVASGVSLANTITLSGGTISGGGSITSAIVIGAGSTISPGNSPGTLTTGTETWATGGTYLWEINDVDAGAGTGWDLIAITNQLNITATAGGKFTLELHSLTLANNDGAVHDFNPLADYSWMIASTGSGITGFDPAAFNIDALDFVGADSGLFSVSIVGDDLYLNYAGTTAVPEPASITLSALAAAAGGWYYRRRRNPRASSRTAATSILA